MGTLTKRAEWKEGNVMYEQLFDWPQYHLHSIRPSRLPNRYRLPPAEYLLDSAELVSLIAGQNKY